MSERDINSRQSVPPTAVAAPTGTPPPRRFSVQTLREWIAEDEADGVRLNCPAAAPRD